LNQKIYRHIEACHNLDTIGGYPYVYLDGVVFKRSWVGEVRNASMLVAIGIGKDGFQHVLGIAEDGKAELAGRQGPSYST